MAVYIATVAADALDNWRLCKTHGVWGVRERTPGGGKTGTANARRVRTGDQVYVWLSKRGTRGARSGLLAKTVVTGPFQTRGEGGAIPWPDPGAYLGSFRFRLVEELAEPVPDRFTAPGKVGEESGIQNMALIHGFREVTAAQSLAWLESCFVR